MLNINADGIITIDAYFSNRGQVDKAIDALTKARDAFFPKVEYFDCFLSHDGDQKIRCIKEVRTLTGFGLKEAKDIVERVAYDGIPYAVARGVDAQAADRIKLDFASFGAKIEIREAA